MQKSYNCFTGYWGSQIRIDVFCLWHNPLNIENRWFWFTIKTPERKVFTSALNVEDRLDLKNFERMFIIINNNNNNYLHLNFCKDYILFNSKHLVKCGKGWFYSINNTN